MTRIEKIKKRLFEVEYYTKKEWWGSDKTILTNDDIKKESVMIRKAVATAYVCENMPVEVKPDELIVGIAAMASIGFGKEFPDYALPEEKEKASASCFTTKAPWGHHPPDYGMVLNRGLRGIQSDIYARIDEECSKEQPDQERMDFFRAMLITLDGVAALAGRYADLTIKCANEETDPVRRRELMEISRICRKVPMEPAETLQEALQSFWFVFIANHSTMEYIPTGRSDQYLYPFYQHDVEQGILTAEQADELVGSWLAKFSERVQLNQDHWEVHMTEEEQGDGGDPEDMAVSFVMENDESYNYGTSANHWLINMILGGVTPSGEDATNDMTYSILKMWGYLEPVVPVLSVRLHEDAPKKLYEECAKILRKGSGEPALYNDATVIKGLTEMGIPLEDARDYSNDGCWEVLIPGKSYFSYAHVELLQMLEYVLQHGMSLARNKKENEDLGELSQYKSFDDFYAAVMQLVDIQIGRILRNKVEYYHDRYKIAPSPLLSSMMHDCVERGMDLSLDGTKYNLYSFIITGIANFTDSMLAIKKLVYESGELTLEQVAELCRSNFKGEEALRQRIINKIPKVGNDNDEVDELMVRTLNDCYELVIKKQEEGKSGNLKLCCGIGTFENYARFGHNVGASPDGRMSQESISSNYSPALGLDLKGPTAAIKSATKEQLYKFVTGCPLDMQINSNEVEGDEGIARMVGLMKSFCDLGGHIMTLTGVSSEMLEDAQKNPMKHQGLRVRMGGLSAYFIQLSREMQDTMIKRIKHTA
ncbi:pyruvate-formate lyase [Ruminococcus sp. OA3]|uniref:pyruvate formate lyase family protein n=1 Tax=Ruminococcus sp. OA3 TaxID=2914164 RepID=UPI001F05BD87|nr:pyruvate formate lyase family protein [Ruminococcus sp. OA3]MCH1981461.1 pyruvate-formate lyase [Ruminococcus sp. OA3]